MLFALWVLFASAMSLLIKVVYEQIRMAIVNVRDIHVLVFRCEGLQQCDSLSPTSISACNHSLPGAK